VLVLIGAAPVSAASDHRKIITDSPWQKPGLPACILAGGFIVR
jgi:hypothetical protein